MFDENVCVCVCVCLFVCECVCVYIYIYISIKGGGGSANLAKKIKLFQKKVRLLGYDISEGQIRPIDKAI